MTHISYLSWNTFVTVLHYDHLLKQPGNEAYSGWESKRGFAFRNLQEPSTARDPYNSNVNCIWLLYRAPAYR
ncbi:hypothetical protein Y1Q_0001512 [Alligator mississippiensis]|uniref:Uncharacterized protein n=1 Tax=Alligator mississippiensis TaxID=8496 RepID=A0A151M9U9_ALLMI|nr:hypothetical protein Y1Q_0001512 [Alligator mississippiensis]